MRKAWTSVAATVLFTAMMLAPNVGRAGPVSVNEAHGWITIDATEASVDLILTKLGEAEGFVLQVSWKTPRSDVVSGRFEGSLTTVLARLLHNESHMIVHSTDVDSGIARIVLFGAADDSSGGQTTTAPATPSPVAAAPVPAARTRSSPAPTSVQPKPLPREVIAPPQPQRQSAARIRGGAIY